MFPERRRGAGGGRGAGAVRAGRVAHLVHRLAGLDGDGLVEGEAGAVVPLGVHIGEHRDEEARLQTLRGERPALRLTKLADTQTHGTRQTDRGRYTARQSQTLRVRDFATGKTGRHIAVR